MELPVSHLQLGPPSNKWRENRKEKNEKKKKKKLKNCSMFFLYGYSFIVA
jgi:hypothetical protein